jgi:S-adenosylhomocysteine hydrolase
MILYSKDNNKIKCTKCNQPKFKNFDHIVGTIDGKKINFWFSIQNNGSNYYFEYNSQWYRTSIVTDDGLDLFEYIYNDREKFFTKRTE